MSEEVVPTEVPVEVPAEVEPEAVTLPSDEVAFDMPEKFAGKSAEEIAKSYMELEAMKNEPKEELSEEPIEEHDATTQDLIDEYTKRGTEITEEDYKVLEEKGYSKEQVDTYKAGVESQTAQKAVALMETAGTTPDEAKLAGEWARDSWSAERVEGFNNAISTASEAVQIQMLQMLTESYRGKAEVVAPTDPVHAQTRAQAPTVGYESMEQMVSDMSNPKYDQRSFSFDRAYYNAVRAKAAKSSL